MNCGLFQLKKIIYLGCNASQKVILFYLLQDVQLVNPLLTSRRKSSEQLLKNIVPRVLVKNDNGNRNGKGSGGYSIVTK